MKKAVYILTCATALGLYACNTDEELSLQKIAVDFAVAQSGMEGDNASIGLKLSRVSDQDLDVTLQMSSDDVSGSDLVITPSLTDDQLVVTIPAGQSTAAFTVAKAAGSNPEGSATFAISALSSTRGYKIGTTTQTVLHFNPIVSQNGKLTLEGNAGTEKYANMVYVDLSNNSQTQIARKSWNLGFYCGDEFRVVLNSSYATVAAGSGKNSFSAVTLDDAKAAPNLAAGSMSDDFSGDWVDDVKGNLSKTAFGEIAAADADNQVFFVASENNKTDAESQPDPSLWYKVKVTRNGEGYRVEFGNVGDTTPQVLEIEKDPLYNFIGLSLETGQQTPAQCEKRKWDIMWAYAASVTTMNGRDITSFSQDVVTTNTAAGVQTAMVMTADIAYDAFTKADIASTTFQTEANVIGTTWRTPAMPGVTNAGVKTDRFFVLKDVAGNYYKLRFTKFGTGTDGTERGRPEVEYTLLN